MLEKYGNFQDTLNDTKFSIRSFSESNLRMFYECGMNVEANYAYRIRNRM